MRNEIGIHTASSESEDGTLLFFGPEWRRKLNPSDKQPSCRLPRWRPADGWWTEIIAWSMALSFLAIWIVGFIEVTKWLANVLS